MNATLNDAERRMLADAVAIANVPSLLMVLVQLSGEMHWLEPPYRPGRGMGLGDNDSGGLPEEIQLEIRAASLEAILAWCDGKAPAIEDPSPEILVRMLSAAMGETVPDEYGEFTASLMGYRPVPERKLDIPDGFHVVIVGAGVSGICTAVNLQAAGIPFTILEKNPEVGGVWYENRYPGAGVDTPNHLYSFSFAIHDWSMYYALRDDLHGYLEHITDKFGLRSNIRFNTDVDRAEWDERQQCWKVQARTGNGAETFTGNVLVSASGIFNPPVKPDIEGLAEFGGESFHTAEWPADVDLKGRRVAIIGNGASCMQTGPEIQHDVESLTIFQRSPHWAAPFEQFRKPVPDPIRFLMRTVPLYQAWYRVRLGWTINDRLHSALHKDPDWAHPERSLNATNDAHRAYFTNYIREELGDRQDLIDKVLPTYPPFGKRMLLDNGWYRMLRNDRVTLVDDPIVRIENNRIVTDTGEAYDADVLIIATGFDVLRFINTFEVYGRSGRSLREAWDDDNAQAYLGTVVPDFPNFFTLYGPNLQPGHGGSLIVVVEMQVHFIMDVLRQMSEQGITSVECREEVCRAYNDRVDAAHDQMVWSHEGMSTYYRNARGRIVVNSPFRNVDYFEMTRQADLDEFKVTKTRGDTISSAG